MRRLPRHIPALLLFIIYLVIVMSPLAPFAMHSPVIAHALTGKCAMDCSICGCSAERSANRTCCCWLNRIQLVHHDHEEEDDHNKPACCKKNGLKQNSAASSVRSLPCNSGKNIAFTGGEKVDVIPFRYIMGTITAIASPLSTPIPVCRTEWLSEPPDPPPKLRTIS